MKSVAALTGAAAIMMAGFSEKPEMTERCAADKEDFTAAHFMMTSFPELGPLDYDTAFQTEDGRVKVFLRSTEKEQRRAALIVYGEVIEDQLLKFVVSARDLSTPYFSDIVTVNKVGSEYDVTKELRYEGEFIVTDCGDIKVAKMKKFEKTIEPVTRRVSSGDLVPQVREFLPVFTTKNYKNEFSL